MPLTAQQIAMIKQLALNAQAAPAGPKPAMTPQQLMAIKARLAPPPAPAPQQIGMTPQMLMAAKAKLAQPVSRPIPPGPSMQRVPTPAMADGGEVEPRHKHEISDDNVQVMYKGGEACYAEGGNVTKDYNDVGYADGGDVDDTDAVPQEAAAPEAVPAATAQATTPELSTSMSEQLANTDPGQLKKLLALRDKLGEAPYDAANAAANSTPAPAAEGSKAATEAAYKKLFSKQTAQDIVDEAAIPGKTAKESAQTFLENATPEVVEEIAKASAKKAVGAAAAETAMGTAGKVVMRGAGALAGLYGLYGGPTAETEGAPIEPIPGMPGKAAQGQDIVSHYEDPASLARTMALSKQMTADDIAQATKNAPPAEGSTMGPPAPGTTSPVGTLDKSQYGPAAPSGMEAAATLPPVPPPGSAGGPAGPPAPASNAPATIPAPAAAAPKPIAPAMPPRAMTAAPAPQGAPAAAPDRVSSLQSLLAQMGYNPAALQGAQDQQRQMMQANALAMGGKEIAAAMSRGGYKPNFAANEQINQMATLPVQQQVQQQAIMGTAMKMGLEASDLDDKTQMRDPKSPASVAGREMLATFLPQIKNSPNFDQLSYEDVVKMYQPIDMKMRTDTMRFDTQLRTDAMNQQNQVRAEQHQQQQQQATEQRQAGKEMQLGMALNQANSLRGANGQADKNAQTADRLIDLANNFDPNDPAKVANARTVMNEVTGLLAQAANGGIAHEGQVDMIYPKNISDQFAKLQQFITSAPAGYNIKPFLDQAVQQAKIFKKVGQDYSKRNNSVLLYGAKNAVSPEVYNHYKNFYGLTDNDINSAFNRTEDTTQGGVGNAPPKSPTVTMRDPNGNLRPIPQDQVAAAKAAGGIVVGQ